MSNTEEVRNAILSAADHIEQQPQCWEWFSVNIPNEPNEQACALGWIGFFYGKDKIEDPDHPHLTGIRTVSKKVLGLKDTFSFYNQVREFCDVEPQSISNLENGTDRANVLRLYANKYFPSNNTWEITDGC